MKKILCLCLSFFLILSCAVGLAAEKSESYTTDIETKLEILEMLAIINPREPGVHYKTELANDRELGEYGVFRNISKSGFLNYICNIFGDFGYTDDYSDEAVLLAEQMGIIHTGQKDLNKPLYYDEAMTMLVRALGYGEMAEENGGFPVGYTTIAARIGLTDGIVAKPGETMKDFDAITALYNLINTNSADYIITSDQGIVYKNASNKPVLYEYRRIYKVEGVVDSANGAYLREEIEAAEDGIIIGGYVYQADKDYRDLLGMQVQAYVYDGNEEYDEIVCVIPHHNKEINLSAIDIAAISDDYLKLSYFDEKEKEKELSISPVAKVVYNGLPLVTYEAEKFVPENGSVRLINNDNSAGYDVVFVTSYDTVVVDKISKVNKTVTNVFTYDTDNEALSLYNNGNDEIKIFGNGREMNFSEIKTGDVLLVAKAESTDKRVVTVYLTRESFSAIPTKIRTNNGRTYVSVGDKEYVLGRAYEEALKEKDSEAMEISLGKEYTFYPDKDGAVAYADDNQTATKYAILAGIATEGVFAKKFTLKIFTSEGAWKYLSVAEKITFNENRGTYTEDVIDGIPVSGNEQISVIEYMTNSDGEVSLINIPEEYTGDNKDKFNKKENLRYTYRWSNASFESEIFMEDSLIMWSVNTTDLDNEMAYGITSKSALSGDETYTFSAYNIDEYKFADIIIMISDSAQQAESLTTSDVLVIENIGSAIDGDGVEVGTVTGMMGNYDSVTFYTDDWDILAGLKKGDVISLNKNADGYIIEIAKHYSADSGVVYSNPSIVHVKQAMVQGTVKKIDPEKMRAIIDCGDFGERVVRGWDGMPVFIYYAERDALYRGSLSDIEEGDTITIKIRGSKPYAFCVYQ